MSRCSRPLPSAAYEWQAANDMDLPTQRRPVGRIDWFFTRGLTASAPAVLPAVPPDGSPSSDHETLAVTVRLK
ncbi:MULTISPECIES: hypothetical protein [unclassified Mesorhizobium]|uniref:hypothetical protein n=1 Tax=unclassified Mesorhizobium TaxID=325217 RepID=UPI001FE1E59A|nr:MULTISPECIES: hypothetical protein [unclassified Mesorhizobium]